MKRALLLLATLAPMAAWAAPLPPSPTGRYALDAAACRARDIFATIAKDRIDLPVLTCRGVVYDLASDKGGVRLWKVRATRCAAEAGAGKPPRAFRLEQKAGRLRFLWADGTAGAPLVRCGK